MSFNYKPQYEPLAKYNQWVNWKSIPVEGSKPKKVPVDPRTGNPCNPHDPAVWVDLATAMATGMGVGFVFTDKDPFWFFDVDGCLDSDNQWTPRALELIGRLDGGLVEVSVSGNGMHVFGVGEIPLHACKNVQEGLEFYHTLRFCAMTGNCNEGSPLWDGTAVLPAFITELFPPKGDAENPAEWTSAPIVGWRGHTTDDDLISHACRSNSAQALISGKATFQHLWEADEEVLGATWPNQSDTGLYDASSADQSLANRLAFWTGKDCTRMERLMRKSKLVRDKWDDHKTYLHMTILQACNTVTDVCQLAKADIEVPAVRVDIKDRVGGQYMTTEQQKIWFDGMTYVTAENRILCPDGELLKEAQFKATYGGYPFEFDHEQKVQTDAWKVFTQSEALHFPKASGVCFRPDLEFGAIAKGKVNTYLDPKVHLSDLDPEPFLRHMFLLLPNERDRIILLSYMASCVQYKGYKFQWAPMIQGCEGNGKTLITRCVEHAVGEKYTHMPSAKDLDNKFNKWMYGKIFIGVEDIYVAESRLDLMEALKPMITGDRIEVQGKGADQVTMTTCANFILNSNHKDAIVKSQNDRRYAIMYTAQQNAEDLIRDGMTGNYFPDLYNWLKSGGYGAVAKLLNEFKIPDEFNPATSCQRVPTTSSTEEAVHQSRGGVEHEIIELTEECAVGFAGGWISSSQLKNKFQHRRISSRKLGQIVENLGYIPHPGLVGGRVNNPLMLDGAVRSKLFIKKDSLLANLTGAEIPAKYITDQEAGGNSAIRDRLAQV